MCKIHLNSLLSCIQGTIISIGNIVFIKVYINKRGREHEQKSK